MNEKQLAQALEPLFEMLVELQEKLQTLSRQPGPPGQNAEAADVAAVLQADPAFLEQVRGKDAEAPEFSALVSSLLCQLKADPAFVDLCKVQPDLDELIDRLVELHGEQLRGAPGKDADPPAPLPAPTAADVATALLADPVAVELLQGEDGQDGAGKDGQDGAGIDAKVWAPGVHREGTVVTAHIGQYFRALVDTVAVPGDSPDWQRIGTAGLRWRGLKPDEKTLALGDLYIDGGSLFGLLSDKASMLLQRAKPTPTLKTLRVVKNQLVASFSNGEQLQAELPDVASLQKSVDDLQVQVGEALGAVADLRRQLAALHEDLQS